jgi:phosphoribosyl 1,2-cyclic phosphate phosphodiesterase
VKITFLGTGTSQGVPVIACDCKTCHSEDARDKRLRTSVLLETGGVSVLIDAGPDFRQQMLREKICKLDAILLTHEHKDHISGLDDVRAFNYKSQDAIDIYSEERVLKALKKEYSYVFSEFFREGYSDNASKGVSLPPSCLWFQNREFCLYNRCQLHPGGE